MNDDIPPFLRKPAAGTREDAEWAFMSVTNRIRKVRALGLQPHPSILSYQRTLEDQLRDGGPYEVRYKRMVL